MCIGIVTHSLVVVVPTRYLTEEKRKCLYWPCKLLAISKNARLLTSCSTEYYSDVTTPAVVGIMDTSLLQVLSSHTFCEFEN
jgi:hypothetical protein